MKTINLVMSSVSIVLLGFAVVSCSNSASNPQTSAPSSDQQVLQTPPSDIQNLQSPPPTPVMAPDELINVIKEKQNKYVRKSNNEFDCFTDVDLRNLKTNKIPAKIVSELRADKKFLQLILEIKNLSAENREKLFEKGLKTYAKTWAENGRIDSTGQTDAGQEAHQLICFEIVKLAKELVSK